MYHITATVAPVAPSSGLLRHNAALPPLPGAMDHSSSPASEPSIFAGGCYDTEATWEAASASAPGDGPPSAGSGSGVGLGLVLNPNVLDAGAFYRGVRRTGLQTGRPSA